MPPLTRRLWDSISGTYGAILAHPFITGLTTGELAHESFVFYVVQDSLYLSQYARALALCGARAPDDETVKMFAEHAAAAIAVERQLHETFFKDFGLSDEDMRRTEPAPTNVAYTSYLLATAHNASFAEALGAVLPCYWIYREVGDALVASGSPDPLYMRWIELYGGEEYSAVVDRVLELTDQIGADVSRSEEARMTTHFRTTARFEWMFWDMGFRRECWPV